MSEVLDVELRRKAVFCLRTGIQPSEYDQMTEEEIDAFTAVFNELTEG